MAIFKHSDSEHYWSPVILTSNFFFLFHFLLSFLPFVIEKYKLIFFLNTLEEAHWLFNHIRLQNKVEISQHGLQYFSGFRANVHSKLYVWVPSFTPLPSSGSHPSPHFPSAVLQCYPGLPSGHCPRTTTSCCLGPWWYVYICFPHWDICPIRWGGAVCHFTFIFFRASNTDSCIVGGAEEVVAKWKQILHSHFILYMLKPLLKKSIFGWAFEKTTFALLLFPHILGILFVLDV